MVKTQTHAHTYATCFVQRVYVFLMVLCVLVGEGGGGGEGNKRDVCM